MEQLETMEAIEREINKVVRNPSEMDLERYYYYIEHGTDMSMIAPLPDNQFDIFYKLVPAHLKSPAIMKDLHVDLKEDIEEAYVYSMRKSIVDYVMMNLNERDRLKIEWVPKKFNLKLVQCFFLFVKVFY
jgi:dynein heavy chain